MEGTVRLRIQLGEEDFVKLNLPDGLPSSVDELTETIKNKCNIRYDFRLHYLDPDFNAFVNITEITDIFDRATVKVVALSVPDSDLESSIEKSSEAATSMSSDDTVLLDSPDCSKNPWMSSEDTALLASPDCSKNPWPLKFHIPTFSYDVEAKLRKGNQRYQEDGTLLTQGVVNKSAILEKLAETIYGFKAYPTDLQLSQVAEALVETHPCLREPFGSGFYGWKTSLKYKMGNYRTKLRASGIAEVCVNAVLHKRPGEEKPAKAVKKPKKAEVNYLPDHPLGETPESLEEERVSLITDFRKRGSEEEVAQKMEKTYSARRQEVVNGKPLVSVLKERWPALFTESQVSFHLLLLSEFMAMYRNQ